MKIAILGGSFNPPHIGHLFIAQQVREIFNVDEVWFMPSYKHPFRKKTISVTHRLKMLRLLENDFIRISEFEIKKNGYSYTIDTLQTLAKDKPGNQYSWIIGSDQLPQFHKWKNWQKLITNYNLIIFPRMIDPLQLEPYIKKTFQLNKLPKNIQIPKSDNLFTTNISSTLIRKRVKSHQTISYLVTPKVEDYILKQKIYEK